MENPRGFCGFSDFQAGSDKKSCFGGGVGGMLGGHILGTRGFSIDFSARVPGSAVNVTATDQLGGSATGGCRMVSRLGSTRIDLDYLLDRCDRITQVCPHWSAVARERMAVGLDDEMVLGRLLWDFVHGGATQRLYDALLEQTRRSGRKLSFNYRGDCPGSIRYMRLEMLPYSAGGVRLRSELLFDQPRERSVYFTHVAYLRHPELMLCSLCQKLEHHGRWYTLDEAIDHTDAIDDLMPTEVGDTVCDNCVTRLELATGVRL